MYCTCQLSQVECTSLTMFINLHYQWDFLLGKERPEKSNFLPIKRMILHTDLPQSFTSSVHWHVEANYILIPFILKRKQWSWKALYGDSRTTCTKPWQVYLVLLPTHNGIVITIYIAGLQPIRIKKIPWLFHWPQNNFHWPCMWLMCE